MTKTTFLLAASALVAIPSSAGIYHLATSSSSKTSEQVESNEEDKAQETEQIKEEKETGPAIEEEVRDRGDESELNEETELDNGSISLEEYIKRSFSEIRDIFHYSFIDLQAGKRTNQLEVFVMENDFRRQSFEPLLTEFLDKEEHQNKDFKTIAQDVLGLTLIDSNDEESWSKLAQIRKDEAETQTDWDQGADRTQLNPLGVIPTKESVKNFCQSPTEENSNLGWYAPTRAEEEKKKEYRLFNYYSYCTKESHYLDSRLNFDPVQ